LRYDFIDQYSDIDSPIHRLDPRIKIISTLIAIGIIASEDAARFKYFSLYFALIALLIVISRLPLRYILKRCLIVSPFIVMAAIFLPISQLLTHNIPYTFQHLAIPSIVILCRAYLAVILLILMTSTDKFHRILLALRKLKLPKLLGIISALIYRYLFLLLDEAAKTTWARESRTFGKLKIHKFKVYGYQMAMIFLRSWERAKSIHRAMLSRGFNGEFPETHNLNLTVSDICKSSLFIAILFTIRLL
jgi:cobalt/nickel transport system permease protein